MQGVQGYQIPVCHDDHKGHENISAYLHFSAFLWISLHSSSVLYIYLHCYNVQFLVSKWLLLLIYEMWNVLNLSISLCSKWERRIIWQWWRQRGKETILGCRKSSSLPTATPTTSITAIVETVVADVSVCASRMLWWRTSIVTSLYSDTNHWFLATGNGRDCWESHSHLTRHRLLCYFPTNMNEIHKSRYQAIAPKHQRIRQIQWI